MPSPSATVAAAYKPAFKQLNRQEKRVRNLDRKQARDEKAYRQWLASTQRSIAATSQQQQAQLATVEQGFHQQLVGSIGQANAAAGNRAAQVGGPGAAAGGDSLGDAVQGSATAASANLGENVVGHIAAGRGMLASVSTNNLAFVAAQSAKRKAATLEAISKLADARGDLAAKRAADSAKAEADAQAQAAEMAWKQMQFEADQAYKAATLDQGQQRINATVVNERVNRRLARQRIKASNQGRGRSRLGSPATAQQRAAAAQRFDKAVALASGQIAAMDDQGHKLSQRPEIIGPNRGGAPAAKVTSWLQGLGYTRAEAEAAVFQTVYPNKRLPKALSRRLKRVTTG